MFSDEEPNWINLTTLIKPSLGLHWTDLFYTLLGRHGLPSLLYTHTHTANVLTYTANVLTYTDTHTHSKRTLHNIHRRCTYIGLTANVLTSQTNTTNVLTECFCFVSRPDATIYNFLCKIFWSPFPHQVYCKTIILKSKSQSLVGKATANWRLSALGSFHY